MTELYITMCRAATELQQAWKINYGDTIYSESIKIERGIYYVCSWFYKDKLIVYNKTGNYNKHIAIDEPITWLPTIEQLIQLILKHPWFFRIFDRKNDYDSDEIYLLDEFSKWAAEPKTQDRKLSIKENLLAFYMRFFHRKYWSFDGNCWDRVYSDKMTDYMYESLESMDKKRNNMEETEEKICENCKWWEFERKEFYNKTGKCKGDPVKAESGIETHFTGILLETGYYGFTSSILTTADFGCIFWEENRE